MFILRSLTDPVWMWSRGFTTGPVELLQCAVCLFTPPWHLGCLKLSFLHSFFSLLLFFLVSWYIICIYVADHILWRLCSFFLFPYFLCSSMYIISVFKSSNFWVYVCCWISQYIFCHFYTSALLNFDLLILLLPHVWFSCLSWDRPTLQMK